MPPGERVRGRDVLVHAFLPITTATAEALSARSCPEPAGTAHFRALGTSPVAQTNVVSDTLQDGLSSVLHVA